MMPKRISLLGCGLAFAIGAGGYDLLRPAVAPIEKSASHPDQETRAAAAPSRPRERPEDETVARLLLAVKVPAEHEEELRDAVRKLVREPGFINVIWNRTPEPERAGVLEALMTKLKADAPSASWQVVRQAKFNVAAIATNRFLNILGADPAEVLEVIALKESEISPAFANSVRGSFAWNPRFARRLLEESLTGGHYGEDVENSAAIRLLGDGQPLPEAAMELPAVKQWLEQRAAAEGAKSWLAGGCQPEREEEVVRGDRSGSTISKLVDGGSSLSPAQVAALQRPALQRWRSKVADRLAAKGRIEELTGLYASPGVNADEEIAKAVARAREGGVGLAGLEKLARTIQDEGQYQSTLGMTLAAAAKEDPEGARRYLSQLADPAVRAEVAQTIEQSSTQP